MIRVPELELRDVNGVTRAFRVDTGVEIDIPSFPRPSVDQDEWVTKLSPAALEAARLYYTDKWTWDDDSEKYRDLVSLIEAHKRNGGIVMGYKGREKAEAAYFYCPYVPTKL